MLTKPERKALENLAGNKTQKRKVMRAQIILYLFVQGKNINETSQELNVSLKTVQRWVQRWQESSEEPDVVKRLANASGDKPNYKIPQNATTGINAIFGQWPGEESDEELEKFLEQLS